eukprot:243356-Pyramimonas_sp.AAC.2
MQATSNPPPTQLGSLKDVPPADALPLRPALSYPRLYLTLMIRGLMLCGRFVASSKQAYQHLKATGIATMAVDHSVSMLSIFASFLTGMAGMGVGYLLVKVTVLLNRENGNASETL